MVCPFERKYSRNVERISFDFIDLFYCTAAKPRDAADIPGNASSGVDSSVLQQPRAHRSHRALVRRRQLLQRPARVERREQLAVLFLGPGLARLRGQLLPAPLEALHALERGG